MIGEIIFIGEGFDEQEGRLEDEALVWTSDIDGDLGIGASTKHIFIHRRPHDNPNRDQRKGLFRNRFNFYYRNRFER